MADITLEAFEAEARAFLEANARRKESEKAFVWGEGEDNVALFEEKDEARERAELARAQAWRAKKFDAGFGWITGPARFGGRELPHAYDRAFQRLEGEYDVPSESFFSIGLGMVAPTIKDHATDTVKDAYLQKLHRGDLVACQLFSEPGAGSDLASLQTGAAERDGDEWIINGQKVWTSGAHYSDIGEIICRTDPNLPKHRGLTGFVVDMNAPGVEVRPLRQMTGGANFNEVFFTDVRVRDDHRLGDVNNGWNVALTTLMNERASIGAGGGGGGGGLMVRVVEMVRHFGLANDPLVRQELATLIMHTRVASYTNRRAMDRMRVGQLPGPEMSIAKLAGTQNTTRLSNFVANVLGPRITADTGEWGTFSWNQVLLASPAGRIAGGSDEVMRNIVGERVLGLPKDVGIDTTSAFKDLKVGTQKA